MLYIDIKYNIVTRTDRRKRRTEINTKDKDTCSRLVAAVGIRDTNDRFLLYVTWK